MTFLQCDPGWYVHKTDVQNKSDYNAKTHRFSVCDLNFWIGVNARVVVAPFARSHLWCICAAVSVGSQCVVTSFARRNL